MARTDRIRWDHFFRGEAHKPYPAPDSLLLQYTPPVAPEADATALDLAAGLGQNGLWLASQGYRTDLMDISRVALRRAHAQMGARQLRNANLLQVDLDQVQLENSLYDVIVVFRYLRRDLFHMLRDALKPGGRILYSTYNVRYLHSVPGFNRAFLLEMGELPGYFPAWQVIDHEERGHNTHFVAVKPR